MDRLAKETIYKLPLVLEAQPEGGYTVTCPLLPELITEGDTVRDALVKAEDALAAVLEAFEELGRPLPSFLPLRQGTLMPDWGSKDLNLGTLRAVVMQLGLDWDAFQEAQDGTTAVTPGVFPDIP